MLKHLATFAILFLTVILQVSFLPNFFPAHATPDLVLIVLIFLAARRGFGETWRLAVGAGLILDIFLSYPIGANVLAFSLVALVTSYLAKRFLVTPAFLRFFILLLLIIIGTAAYDLALAAIMKIFLSLQNAGGSAAPLFSFEIWGKIISNAGMFLLAYWPLRKYEKIKNYYGQRVILQNNVR